MNNGGQNIGLQQIVLDKVVAYFNSLFDHGRVKLNGVFTDYSIMRTIIDGTTIRKYINLETEMGYVEEVQLLSDTNEVLFIEPLSVEKREDGLILAFTFELTLERKPDDN